LWETNQNSIKTKVIKAIQGRPSLINKAAWMVGARILGLGFGVVGAIWSARCLGPRNLGISGMVQSIVLQATVFIGIISPTVLIREYKNLESDQARTRLVKATNWFRFLLAAFVCLAAGIVLAFHWVPTTYQIVGWMFIPNLLLVSIQPIWIFQAAEKQQFQSVIAIFQPALTALIYLVFFKPGMSAGADLVVISSVALTLLIVYWYAVYQLIPLKGNPFAFQGLKEAWNLAMRSRWLYVSALAIYIYTLLEQPLLGWFCSVEELGKYRTAVRVTDSLNATFSIIPMILFPRFIEWRKKGEEIFRKRQYKLAVFFTIFGLVTATLGFIFIPFFYPYIFGAAFAQAGLPCAILVFSKIVTVVNGIYGWGLLTDHRYDKAVSLVLIFTAFFSLVSNLFFIPLFGMYGAAGVNLSSEIFVLIAFIWLSARRYRFVMIS
jgi:O-antigen/teichoic acid export membrane protein